MNAVPVMQSADLVLPAVVDTRDLVSINVRPGRAIADGDVVADVNVTDVDGLIIADPDTRKPRRFSCARTVWKSVARLTGDCWAIVDSGSRIDARASHPRQRLRGQRSPHAQKIAQITR